MSREYLDSVTKYLKTITDISLPEYVMAVIPASNVKGEFSDFLYAAYITLMNIGVGESKEIATSYLKEAFSYSDLAELISGTTIPHINGRTRINTKQKTVKIRTP